MNPDDPDAIVVAEDIYRAGRLIGSVWHRSDEPVFQIALRGPRFKWTGAFPSRVEAISALVVRA